MTISPVFTTTYSLKEVCKWSVGHPMGEFRYVDIRTSLSDQDYPKRTHTILETTLELPSDHARKLVDSMSQ